MNSKLLFLIVVVLFVEVNSSFSFASAQCPVGQVCSSDQQQEYSYDQFQEEYANNPALTAQNYPEYYMRYINENPEEVAKNPQVYENAIRQDVQYINQNKDAFLSYAQTKGITFSSIEGDFKSFDTLTGKIETKGATGQAVTSFSFVGIKIMEQKGGTNFKVNKGGELVYDHPNFVLINGPSVTISGNIEEKDGELVLSKGKYSQGIDINIELNGDNRGKLIQGCKDVGESNCGFIEVDAVSSPIQLPRGIITKGKAVIVSEFDVDILPNSEYMGKYGFKFSATKETRIINGLTHGCLGVRHSCIEESNPYFGVEGGDEGQEELKRIVITAVDGNQIKIEVKDSSYNNIIVKQISKLPSEAEVDLRIRKKDGSKSRIIFSSGKPISQGKLAGLQTNIGHVFEEERIRYPWVIYQGKPSANTKGKLSEGLTENVLKLAAEKRRSELSLVFDAIDTLNIREVTSIVGNAKVDKAGLKQILDKYDPDPERVMLTSAERLMEKMRVLGKHNIDTPEAVELQGELLEEFNEVYPREVTTLLIVTSGREELQERVLLKASEVYNPGDALRNVESDVLRRMIIERTKTVPVGGGTFFERDKSAYPIQNYLEELEDLNPELQTLAMENLDFESGIFVDHSYKGEALRRVLEFHEDKPEQMRVLLDKIPMREDMGFNPVGFSAIYFNEEFQEKTEGMDFANKYSIAYTAQRYLDQRGTWLPTDRTEVIDLIIQQRERFSKYVVLDENTYYIPLTHEEEWFQNSEMVQLARDSGVEQIADQDLKGTAAKGRFLDFVSGSKDKGKTTIHFNNHGGPNHQWLSAGQSGVETSDQMKRPDAISYVEFGDALAERGNLGEVTVMIDSCYSKDFTDNLYHYLHAVKGTTDMPTVITETNRGQVGWVNTFGPALERVHQEGQPLTGRDILGVESETFFKQDLTVTMPVTSEEEAKFSKPETPGVIDLGSPIDEGAAETPQKPEGELSEEMPAEVPPTVIEIAQNEQEMEERLVVG